MDWICFSALHAKSPWLVNCITIEEVSDLRGSLNLAWKSVVNPHSWPYRLGFPHEGRENASLVPKAWPNKTPMTLLLSEPRSYVLSPHETQHGCFSFAVHACEKESLNERVRSPCKSTSNPVNADASEARNYLHEHHHPRAGKDAWKFICSITFYRGSPLDNLSFTLGVHSFKKVPLKRE